MKSKLGHGHRRTESDRFLQNYIQPKMKIKLCENDNDAPEIMKCLWESNRKNKTKTVFIEDIELPPQISDQNQMFMFGRNHSCLKQVHHSSQFLKKIPEAPQKRSKSNLYLLGNKENTKTKDSDKNQKRKKCLYSDKRLKKQNKAEIKNYKRSDYHMSLHKKNKSCVNSQIRHSEKQKDGHFHLASSYYFHFQNQNQRQTRTCPNSKKANNKNALKEKGKKERKSCEKRNKDQQIRIKDDNYQEYLIQKEQQLWSENELNEDDWDKQFISQTIIKQDPLKVIKKRKKSNYQKQKTKEKFKIEKVNKKLEDHKKSVKYKSEIVKINKKNNQACKQIKNGKQKKELLYYSQK